MRHITPVMVCRKRKHLIAPSPADFISSAAAVMEDTSPGLHRLVPLQLKRPLRSIRLSLTYLPHHQTLYSHQTSLHSSGGVLINIGSSPEPAWPEQQSSFSKILFRLLPASSSYHIAPQSNSLSVMRFTPSSYLCLNKHR